MENSTSYRTLYRSKFQKWVTTSTSHGLPNIFQTKNPIIRVMWTLAVLGSCGYCVSSIVTSIQDFLKYKTTLSSQIIQDIPATFPAVTFCNLNPFDLSGNGIHYLTILVNALSRPECLDYLKSYKQCVDTDYVDYDYCVEIIDAVNRECQHADSFYKINGFIAEKVTDDIIKKEELGFDLFEEMLHFISINGDLPKESDFTTFWSHQYGNCYTFNNPIDTANLYKNSQKGANMGFTIRLFLKNYVLNDFDYFTEKTGLYLIVHNQSTLPVTLNKGINLPPGKEVNIAVDRVFKTKLAEPYSNCIDKLESADAYAQRLFGFFRDINITYYDQDVCFTLCYQDKLIDACGCQNIVTGKIRGASYCWTEAEYGCMEITYPQSLNQIYKDFCINACPEKCSTVDYRLKVDYSNYPSKSNMRAIRLTHTNLPADEAKLFKFTKESFISVNVFYDNLQYTVVEENALVTTETLLGNVGGQLGLFIGISFLSFIEIIEVAIEFLNIFYKQKKEQYSTRRAARNSEKNKEIQVDENIATISISVSN